MIKIITSESVNCGHPDKTCDIIADSFLDAALSQDKDCQMAVECAIKDNRLMIYGESTTSAKINYEKITISFDFGLLLFGSLRTDCGRSEGYNSQPFRQASG